MRVIVINDLSDLTDDMTDIARGARKDMVGVVKEGIRVGAQVARDNAKRTAGKHGKHYPRSITASMNGIVSFGGVGGISGEYGPNSAMPQGGMSFENGSRNQPPHRDLAKSADLIGPSFGQEVAQLPDRWFW